MKITDSLPQLSPRLMRLGLLAALVAATGAFGFAAVGHAGPGHRGGPGRMLMRMVENLDLTEDQELALVRIRREAREQHKTMRQARRADMQFFAAELKKENPDRAALHAQIDAAIDRFKKRAHAMLDQAVDFHGELTPAQKAELAKQIDTMQARFEARRKGFEGAPE